MCVTDVHRRNSDCLFNFGTVDGLLYSGKFHKRSGDLATVTYRLRYLRRMYRELDLYIVEVEWMVF